METISITDPRAPAAMLATLRAGGLVIAPTETVYGCFADATNPDSVTKLLAYKRRPAGKAISVAVADQKTAEQYVSLTDQARAIYRNFLPGPVTVVSASRHLADRRLESEFGTLGIRIPGHDWLLSVLRSFASAVTATSANASSQKTPYTISDVLTRLSSKQKNLIDLIIDAGTLPKNPPSLVIDTTTSTPIVMRPNAAIDQFSSTANQTYLTHDETETYALAGKLLLQNWSTLCQTGFIIALDGDLGAGKTTLTAGFGQFLGINAIINSPTYTYLKEYPYTKFEHNGTLYHLDAWTIDRPELLAALNLDACQKPSNLLVIEWYEQIAPFFQPRVPLLHLKLRVTGQTSRSITLEAQP